MRREERAFALSRVYANAVANARLDEPDQLRLLLHNEVN